MERYVAYGKRVRQFSEETKLETGEKTQRET